MAKVTLVESVTPGTALTLVEAHGFAEYLWVGVSGDVTLTTPTGDVTFLNVAAGEWHCMPPFSAVPAAGTDATDIIAGYC